MVALAREATRRGHSVDVFCRSPVLPELQAELARCRVGVESLTELEADFRKGARRLSTYDVLHLNFIGIRDRAALMSYAAFPARVVFVDHWSGRPASESPIRRMVRRALDAAMALRVSGVAAVSEYVRVRDSARYLLGPERCRTLYNGVDVTRFRPRESSRDPAAPFRVMCVAHLIPFKGVDHLIRAFARIRSDSSELWIVGDGVEERNLRRLAEEQGLGGRARFLGLRSDVAELMRDVDVFVHPAVWSEAFGLTIAEAMATGLPVVASRTGAIPELLRDHQEGLLVAPGDEAELARTLERLASDSGLRARLGRAARARAEKVFALDAAARAHVDYCEAHARRATPARPTPVRPRPVRER